MPYPNEHAARIRQPGDFQKDTFRRKNIADGIDIIIGKLKGESSMTIQAYRFDADVFTASEAKKWLKDHDIKYISFEAASGKDMEVDDMEKKFLSIPFEIIETKEIEEKSGKKFFTFKGYGSTFGNMDLVRDIMVRGAFLRSLSIRMPILLWQHDMREPIGVFDKCYEDEKGLCVEAKMPIADDLVRGRVMPQMDIGSVKSMSIGYTTKVYEYDKEQNVYYLKDVDLWEISLVTIPANPQALVTDMKSLKEASNIRELESYLKNSGHSRKECAIIISKLKDFVRDGQDLESDDLRDAGLKELCEGIRSLKL